MCDLVCMCVCVHRSRSGADPLLHSPDPAAGGHIIPRHHLSSVGLQRSIHPLSQRLPGSHRVSVQFCWNHTTPAPYKGQSNTVGQVLIWPRRWLLYYKPGNTYPSVFSLRRSKKKRKILQPLPGVLSWHGSHIISKWWPSISWFLLITKSRLSISYLRHILTSSLSIQVIGLYIMIMIYIYSIDRSISQIWLTIS